MSILKGEAALSALVGVVPYIVEALPDEMALFVTDGKKYLQVAEGPELQTGIKLGSKILGKATEKCMQEKRKTVYHIREGVPFKGVNVPVCDENGMPVGTVICAIGRKTQQEVNKYATSLSAALDEMAAVSAEMAQSAARLAAIGEDLLTKSQLSSERIENTAVIINAITEISKQTNLLGLNASIEAARAGDNGRGFSVVAEEIQNLAAEARKAAQEVKAIVQEVAAAVTGMIEAARESGTIAQKQASATEESAAAIA